MPHEQVDEDLSLEQIEDDPWGPAPSDATRLIATVHQLRQKPLRSLTAEDLRLLLSQDMGANVLVPHTLALLKSEPLVEGDLYPGDVLVAMLNVSPSYWRANPVYLTTLDRILNSIEDSDADIKADIEAFRARVKG
jgi:contact-dependent growth inhibition (CDI) system CdiI-like immunity protein